MPWTDCVCLCDVSGYRRTTRLWIPTCKCPTMGWWLQRRTWRWSAPVRWTSTSSLLTHRGATSPSDLQCTAVSEGERVCVLWTQWCDRHVFTSSSLHSHLLFSPQSLKSGSLLSPTPLGSRSFPERWWGRRESGSSSSYPSPPPISPSTANTGNSLYTLYAADGCQIKGETWMHEWRNTMNADASRQRTRDHWRVWCMQYVTAFAITRSQPSWTSMGDFRVF